MPETWSHLIVPFQEKPGFNEFIIEEKQVNSGIGSLAERAFQKCLQEEYIFQEIGARIIRDKLNDFLWIEKNLSVHPNLSPNLYFQRHTNAFPLVHKVFVVVDNQRSSCFYHQHHHQHPQRE